ncbi:hypothetical protein [Microbispora sp. KK1-11]|uniref:hypothetical protein n=1 Tax=Microbispora sp. KK1-11 TaxID=2053005 RepID=UPI00115B66B1|nr:hypothetical protein [Microbispora sp. KK1-11]TQS19866.1 hypothetical protein FLW16_41330 [Microbispora sp. KK1-11]
MRKLSFGGRMTGSARESAQPRRVIPIEDTPLYLEDLGLTVETIHRSIEIGDTARRRVQHRVYPSSYPGMVMWAETLAALRRELLKLRQGWRIGKSSNYETVYSEERGIAFAVVAGDSYTGIQGARDPKLARKRGRKTTERINRNARYIQVPLPGFETEEDELAAPDEVCQTWFIVLRPTSKEIRIEVSYPDSIGDHGYVSGWDKRLLVTPIPISGAVAPIAIDEDQDDDGEDLVGRPPKD